jgi:hypothetical protein
VDDHLDADEREDDRETLLQVAEPSVHVGEQEVQGPQAEDRERIGREHDELLVAHRQHGRHRVDGEQHVSDLDEQQHGEERRRQPPAVHTGEQPLAVELVGERYHLVHQLQELALRRVDVIVVGEHQLGSGEQQERAEDVEHPVELLDQRHAGEDEDRTHDQCTEDAPEQHPVLIPRRHLEVAEDQRPDEDVVDAEALLDEVARDVLARRRTAETPPHGHTEQEADRDPGGRLDGCLAHLYLVALLVHDEQVDEQEHRDEREQTQPPPGGDIELDELEETSACEQHAVSPDRRCHRRYRRGRHRSCWCRWQR